MHRRKFKAYLKKELIPFKCLTHYQLRNSYKNMNNSFGKEHLGKKAKY